jgi:hypothetical protein
MKTQLLLGVALCAAALGSNAQTRQDGESVTIPAPRLQIVVPEHTYRMDRRDFEEYSGGYELSNGQTLTLRHNGFAMYASLDGQEPHRIVATGRNAFVALDRKLQVKIELQPDGKVGGEVLIAMPSQKLADGSPGAEVVRVAMR